MKIQLVADDGVTVMGSATIPGATAPVLLARYNGDEARLLKGLLYGLNTVIDGAVDQYPPADVQAATAAVAAASAACDQLRASYRATEDGETAAE